MEREFKKENAAAQQGAGLLPDRAQPHDLDLEKAVIAAMLREPDPCVDIAIEHLRGAEVFYSHVHREIYQAILDLHNDKNLKVDLVSVANLLLKREKLEAIGGTAYLADLDRAISTTVNLESWCVLLHQYATLRKMIDVCAESLMKCYDSNADVTKLIDEVESDIYSVRNAEQSSSIVQLKDMIRSQFNELRAIMAGQVEVGIPTGFAQLDNYTGGLKPGEMFVLAARPSIGKTSLALNVIRNLALPSRSPHPRSVAFFSLEMTAEQITRRMLCTEAGVSESVFWSKNPGDDVIMRLTGAVSLLKDAKIFIDPTGGLTIAELRAKARRLKLKENIDVIVIDYLQLMHADGRIESRQQEVATISSGIKTLAKDLKVPILVLAQLNREVDKAVGASARPKLAHLRESGTIEQDADVVTFLHRDREEQKKAASVNDSVKAEWIIEKNRNGRTGNLELLFFPARMEFVPASPYGKDDCPAS